MPFGKTSAATVTSKPSIWQRFNQRFASAQRDRRIIQGAKVANLRNLLVSSVRADTEPMTSNQALARGLLTGTLPLQVSRT